MSMVIPFSARKLQEMTLFGKHGTERNLGEMGYEVVNLVHWVQWRAVMIIGDEPSATITAARLYMPEDRTS
jgi:hypothetical protein